jgi:hypothetical protein
MYVRLISNNECIEFIIKYIMTDCLQSPDVNNQSNIISGTDVTVL